MTHARMRSLLLSVLVLVIPVAPGCDCSGNLTPRPTHDGGAVDAHADGGPTISGLQSFTIAPLNQTLDIVNGMPAHQAYTATGHFADGSMRDISALVEWSISSTTLGMFASNTFTTGTISGGIGQVTARANGMMQMTMLTVRVRSTRSIPPTGGGAPIPSMPDHLFGGTSDPSRAPQLVYPNDGVLLPPNLGRIEVHWLRGPSSNTLFEIGFSNPITDVRLYVRCEAPAGISNPNGCIYEINGNDWSSIAQTNRGQGSVMLTVRATDDTGSAVGSSSTITLRFSRDPLMGTLYYWATTSQSIFRYDFGAASGMARAVITPMQAGGRCVGCHAISRDGTRIFASVGGQNSGGIELYDLTSYTALRNDPTGHVSQFGSFNPDGTMMAGVYGDNGAPNDRGLLFFDTRCDAAHMSTCGQIVDMLSIGGRPVSHPSWSPDGSRIAYTDADGFTTSQRPRHGAIGVVTRMAGAWSAPDFIVPRMDGQSWINPDWAPDGSFLVITRSICPGGNLDDMDCNGDSDPSSVVLAVPASGGTPVELTNAMTPGVLDAPRTQLNNTFGRFAPFEFVLSTADTGTARLMWVSFSTTRAYGLRTTPGGNSESGGRGTWLWMTGVRPEDVMAGTDPSFAAFALPFQDLTTSNHIAAWTTQAVGNPTPM